MSLTLSHIHAVCFPIDSHGNAEHLAEDIRQPRVMTLAMHPLTHDRDVGGFSRSQTRERGAKRGVEARAFNTPYVPPKH
jgi:hypothetical protein